MKNFTQNRELSWLDFNKRVIEEAKDRTVPILERLKFLSIYDTNLEEFFMVRVGSLTDLSKLKKQAIDNKSNMTPTEQIRAILDKLIPMYEEKDNIYENLLEDLTEVGINIQKVSDLDEKELSLCQAYFDSKIEPILSFQIIDRVHPLPRLANLSLSVIYDLARKKSKNDENEGIIGIIYVPERLKRYVRISDKTYVLLEDIIKVCGAKVFEGYKAKNSFVMSLTRNADISFDDDDYDVEEDFRSYMKTKLKKRKRLGPVRVEVDQALSQEDTVFLCNNFGISEKSIFLSKTPFQLGFIFDFIESLPDEIKSENTYEKFNPMPKVGLDRHRSMIDQVIEKDRILSYPYESIDPLIKLLDEAANDPSVASIKITLYRIAKDSKIAESLIRASENGKEVIVLMELRARFDEDNNIFWSSRLEEAGCKIIYGFDHYKCHSKVLLITRLVDGEISFITQVSTGNYNEKTAKLYTDFSYLTSNQVIGQDAKDLFDNIMIGNLNGQYNKLMVSPKSMQEGLEKHIREEISKALNGQEGYIRLKMNSISDRGLIDLLQEASCAGVKIEMMVRGICCILPGVEDTTENIEVYQIVGRFLEHHRVYQFGKNNPKVYISSADFMTRNIRNRVEVAVPIEDRDSRDYILEFLDMMFSDDVKSRKLGPDGKYYKPDNINNINAQEKLMGKAIDDFKNLNEYKENKVSNNHKILYPNKERKAYEKRGILDILKKLFKK